MVDDKDVFAFTEFEGLRNNVDQATMEPSDLTYALNVDVSDSKRIMRRSGFAPASIAGTCHSLWGNGSQALMVQGTNLVRVNPDLSASTILTGLTADAPMSFDAVGDRVFFANGHEDGVIEGNQSRTWGVPVPSLPAVAKIPGSLLPGRYQYVTTFLQGDGQESGAVRAGIIELTEPQGLIFSLFGTIRAGIAAVNLYLSQPDGDALYLVDSLNPLGTAATVIGPRAPVYQLKNQLLSPPPVGQHVAYSYGRMYVAAGDRVYPSEPWAPELFDLRRAYEFESNVTMLAPVVGGMFVGTETNTAWIDGADPEKSVHVTKAPYGVIPGTLAYGATDDYSPDAGGIVVYFTTTGGIMRGLPGGALENLTRSRYDIPTAEHGAGIVRIASGTAQYVALLQG